MAATVIHMVRPDDLSHPHTIHIIGPKTKDAVSEILTSISAIVDGQSISGLATDYARLSVRASGEADKLRSLKYLTLFDAQGHYIIKLYEENEIQLGC